MIITVGDSASEERRRRTVALQGAIRECQEREQYLLAQEGTSRYLADLGIDRLVNESADRIIARVLEQDAPEGAGPYLAGRRHALCGIIGTNLATSVTITRRWHAHAREDDPRARRFLGGVL